MPQVWGWRMTVVGCVLCGDDFDNPDPREIHTFSAADRGPTYELHVDCWEREGFPDATRHATEAALAYYDAMCRETFAGALDVLLDSMHGKDLNPAWHAALVRVASNFGVDDDPTIEIDEESLLEAASGDGGDDDGN